MSVRDKVISRLDDLKFEIQRDYLELFGETLPLLKAIAVDEVAHQLVLVAEQDSALDGAEHSEDAYDRPWRELLFAVSGLRHHLRGPGAPALGSPILLAIVDGDGADRLRGLVEEIAENYALFSRIDINIIDSKKIEAGDGDGELDFALASLLPCVRHAIDNEVTVAAQDVDQFWAELRGEIRGVANALASDFGESTATEAVQQILEGLKSDEDRRTLDPKPARAVESLELENFRSFKYAKVALPRVGIVHGANGSGKSSICEALEILWSGRTQRIPSDIDPPEYVRHLNRDGKQFVLGCHFRGDGEEKKEGYGATGIEELSALPLGRTVLAQHVLTEMASNTPRERFGAFLEASGLNLPELDRQADGLRRTACDEANKALAQAGIPPINAVNRNGLEHLRRALGGSFAAQLPSVDRLGGSVDSLIRASDGAYAPIRPLVDPMLPQLLAEVDAALFFSVRAGLGKAPDPTAKVEAAMVALREEANRLRGIADSMRLLVQHFNRALLGGPQAEEPAAASSNPPMPLATAASWLAHVESLKRSALELEQLAPSIDDVDWRQRLDWYTEILQTAIDRSNLDGLKRLVAQQTPAGPPAALVETDLTLLREARFSRAPELSLKKWLRRWLSCKAVLSAEPHVLTS